MKKTLMLSVAILTLSASAFATDYNFHDYSCSDTAIGAANDATEKLPSTVTGTYWITQSFAITRMNASYEIIMRNRDDGRCLLVQVDAFSGATECQLTHVKTTQLNSVKNNDSDSLCQK